MDLEAHTKDLMTRLERDLRIKLEWAAVIHYSTEHPHVHVVLRGCDEYGQALRPTREIREVYPLARGTFARRAAR